MDLRTLKVLRFFHLINKKKYNEKRQIEIVKASPLFDAKWYLEQNPDVKAKKIGAARHYVKYGWKEGRNPSKEFDTEAYLEQYPELVEKNWCPLFHYMLEHKELILPIDWHEVWRKYFGYIYKLYDAYAVKYGKYKGKNQNYILIAKSKYFNKRWYLKMYPDVKKAGVDPVEHYLNEGWKKGYNPSRSFDTEQYLEVYKGVRTAGLNPLLHYEKYHKRQKLHHFLVYDEIKFPLTTKEIKKEFNIRFEKGRIAIFAMFSADGKIPGTTIFYLKGLKKIVKNIICIADNPINIEEIDKIKNLVSYCSFIRHGEYDFGSYKRGYLYIQNNGLLTFCTELIFCNDSCYGPVYPFQRMFTVMEKKQLDFWGIAENNEFQYHLQSYFLVFKPCVFLSDSFKEFITSIRKQKTVQDVILNYEVKFTNILIKSGFCCDSYVKANPETYPYYFCHNLTIFPNFMLEKGNPLVKVKALTKIACNCEGINKTLDVIKQQNKELYSLLKNKEEKLNTDIAFSIILPTYNRKEYIDKAVSSVLKQTYQNFELIIIDDGSTDNTKNYIKKNYAKQIKEGKIRYFYEKNKGVCRARNYGLKQAKNEWIAFLDSDNVLYPYFLEVYVKHIICHREQIFYAIRKNKSTEKLTGNDFNYVKLLQGNYIDLGVLVFNRKIYKKLGGFDENMTRLVDWEFIVRYTQKYRPYFIKLPVLLYNDIDDHARISNSCNYSDNFNYFRKKHCSDYPVVTTMITAYNHEKYIATAIESAIKQTGSFIHEILISDDGSSDNTPQIIADYAAKYPNLIKDISHKNNVGISENMKHCFMAATGKYIAVLEGDDYWTSPQKLEKQMQFLEKSKDCSMVFSKLKILNEQKQTFSYLKRQENLSKKLSGKDVFVSYDLDHSLNLIGNFSCCMFVAKYMKALPDVLFKTRFNEISLWFHLEQKGKIGFINTPLSVYRQYVGGVWSGADKRKQLEQAISCISVAKEVADKKYQQALERHLVQARENMRKLRDYTYYKNLKPAAYPEALQEWCQRLTGKTFNLENPRTFNEKIQWLKLYDSTPLKTRLADKYLVRDWIKEKIGEQYLIPLLGVYDNFDEIDFAKLPNQFVIKCNHGSGWNIIVKDKSKLDLKEVKEKLDEWMSTNFAFLCGLELHYRDIKPKIIIEKYIQELGDALYDYRFFCSNGKVIQIWLDVYSGTPYHQRKIYDKNWNELNIIVKWPRLEKEVEKPKNLEKMIQLSETLSENFALVRVDFYDVNNHIYFGEMTFTSMSGTGKFNPEIEDLKLGNMIKLPKLAYDIDTGKYYKLK